VQQFCDFAADEVDESEQFESEQAFCAGKTAGGVRDPAVGFDFPDASQYLIGNDCFSGVQL
jgi:hypothetical protein